MTRLQVHTARIDSRDPDRLDVTRRAVDVARKRRLSEPPGAFLAPSWGILQPVMEARTRAHDAAEPLRGQSAFTDLMRRARAAEDDGEGIRLATQAREMLDAAWATYVDGYLAEMRVSYSTCRACSKDPRWRAETRLDRLLPHTCDSPASGPSRGILGTGRPPDPPLWFDAAMAAAWERGARSRRARWEWLLARPRVVLVCYCTETERCHRFLLRTRILPTLGAVDAGEILQEAA